MKIKNQASLKTCLLTSNSSRDIRQAQVQLVARAWRIPAVALLFFSFCALPEAIAQPQLTARQLFYNISLRIDTNLYTWEEHRLLVHEEPQLWFYYDEENPIVELRFYHRQQSVRGLEILPGDGYELLDSVLNVNDDHYRAKLRLLKVTLSEFLTLPLRINPAGPRGASIFELRLFPVTKTLAHLPEDPNELFVGEEKTIILESNKPENIRFNPGWTSGLPVNYQLSRREDKIQVQILSTQPGRQELEIPLSLRKPFMNDEGQPVYHLPPVRKAFTVKPARLVFLDIDQREVSFEPGAQREPLEIELSYDSKLRMAKTYRVENQEEPGGRLIAEIFTRNTLGNGRVLCWLRLYDYHSRSEGYLYIKDGDKAVYITNLDIIPETKVTAISLRREGQDWQPGNRVFPGERIEVKLEGQSLHRADFRFDGLAELKVDSIIRNEREIAFSGLVPIDIRQNSIRIFNRSEALRQTLSVQEYERARPFDFVNITYGSQTVNLEEADLLIFTEETLNDIVLHFDRGIIDEGRLYGPQEIELDIQVQERNGPLIDRREIRNITICPDATSPRYRAALEEGCQQTNIHLNEYLRRKTFDLDAWTSVRITLRHKPEKYGKNAQSKTVEFVMHRKTLFDIDVSFPAGLIIKRIEEPGFGNLGGISMAVIGQFSFYRERKIAQAKPFKFGAGFLAFNAFNFSDNNSNRDVGIVALASIYPLPSKDRSRLSFPLYAGGGYFLSESKWFVLFGPGIRVTF
jgi:hypothetical protein